MASPFPLEQMAGTDKASEAEADKVVQVVNEHELLPCLPPELFHKVVSNLHGDDLLRAALVSTTWAAELEPIFEAKCSTLMQQRGRLFVNLRLERHWAAEKDAAARQVALGSGNTASTSCRRRSFPWRRRFSHWSCSRCRERPAIMEVEIRTSQREGLSAFVTDVTSADTSHHEVQGQGDETATENITRGSGDMQANLEQFPAWTLPSVGWSASSGGQDVTLRTICPSCISDPAVVKNVLTWDFVRVTDRAFDDEY